MKKIRLGSTNAKVSEMALGCLNFGTKNSAENSYEQLDFYTEIGGSFLDTANNYAFWEEGGEGGESEKLLGKWMEERKNRKDIFLATKVGAFPINPEKLKKTNHTREGWVKYAEGLSKKAVLNAVEKSLKRLGTDYIDLYYAHIDPRTVPLEETLEAFDSLVKSGKIRYFGLSNYTAWRAEQALNISRKYNWTEFCAAQQFYSYLKPKRGFNFGIQMEAGDEFIDFCRENKNITLLAYTPSLWGAYAIKDRFKDIPLLKNFETKENSKRLSALEKVAEETGATKIQVVYAWIMQGNPKIIPIVAASRMEHLKENLNSVKVKLSEEQIEYLNNSGEKEE
jgi:aryl-alcohol dehydrogenase-like predicted oxidoreductase